MADLKRNKNTGEDTDVGIDEERPEIPTPDEELLPSNDEQTGAEKTEKVERTKQERYLRALLKLYFYVPFKWKDSTCSFHIIYLFIFVIQIVKLSLLTRQMYLYGNDRAKFNSIVYRGHITLRHLLLKNWDASWETLPYPPSHGDFAVYTIDDLESGINYAVSRYYNAENDAIGYYKRVNNDSMQAVVKYFDFPGFHDTNVHSGIQISEKQFKVEHGLTNLTAGGERVYNYSIAKELENLNLSQPMKRMLTTTLKFTIHSVRPHEKTRHALCLRIYGEVTFTDIDDNGQVSVDLDTLTSKTKCDELNVSVEDLKLEYTSIPIGKAVLAFCVSSIVLTVLTDIFGLYVFIETKRYMKTNFKKFYGLKENAEVSDLPNSEYFRFALLKFWDILMLVSDAFTINGTCWILCGTEISAWEIALLDSYAVTLGVGCILAWLSLLRYFKVHYKFYLLFSTLTRAIGDVIAYMACVTMLFVGFMFCGYVVLGPFHVKFQTLSAAAETLFSLVHGDEIYATMAMFDEEQTGSHFVWWFARFYIGIYVSLYTIVVINLLIALFMRANDAIKEKPEDRSLGPMEQALQAFIKKQRGGKHLQGLFYDLLSPRNGESNEETNLGDQLRRIMRRNEETHDVEILKPRTIKTFMRDEKEKVCKRGWRVTVILFTEHVFLKRKKEHA